MVKSIFNSLISGWVFFNTFRDRSTIHDFLIAIGILILVGHLLGDAAFWICGALLIINAITYDCVKNKYGR